MRQKENVYLKKKDHSILVKELKTCNKKCPSRSSKIAMQEKVRQGDSRQKQKQTNKRGARAKIAMHEKLRQRELQTELSDVRTPITPHSAFSLAMFDQMIVALN